VGQKSQYKIDCRWSPEYICKKVDKLHDLFAAIEVRGNCCTNLDFADVIEDTECRCLLYIDPPYYVKGNDLYQHGFTVEDHERLANALRNTEHAWVLSYDDCYEVRQLYKWANVEPLDVNYSITAMKDKDTGERRSRTKTELLIRPKQAKLTSASTALQKKRLADSLATGNLPKSAH
jgi:DNA adenine methylase